jgi:hypothetical protein
MLRDELKRRADRILDRWVEDCLAAYPAEASAAWTRERDPFANPVGNSLRAGTKVLFEAVLDGADAEATKRGLDGIVRIRAVQQMSPSAALGFVFRLKHVIRTELGEALATPALGEELTELEARIDEAALVAFDLFVQYRERVSTLRINELKRNIPWVVTRTNRAVVEREPG